MENDTQPKQATKWAFTFGSGHKHPTTGKPLDRYYLVIDEPDYEKARVRMFNMFDSKFCAQQVFDADFIATMEEYNTYELHKDQWPQEISQEKRQLKAIQEVIDEIFDLDVQRARIESNRSHLMGKLSDMVAKLKDSVNP